MINYMKYVLMLGLFTLKAFSMQEPSGDFSLENHGNGKLTGKSAFFSFRSVEAEDVGRIKEIASQSEIAPGFPTNLDSWVSNHLARQGKGNPYSALVLKEGEDMVGVLGFGRMPVLRTCLHNLGKI